MHGRCFMSSEQAQAIELVANNGQMIIVTQAAGEKFAELSNQLASNGGSEEEKQSIRIYISGGGCSGMQYGMTYSEGFNDYDYRLKANTINEDAFDIVIDAVALDYMNKAEIDYEDNGVSATFVFNNVFEAIGGSGSCGGCGSAS